MFAMPQSKNYSDPAKRREYHRARYLARREEILKRAAERKAASAARKSVESSVCRPCFTGGRTDTESAVEQIEDTRAHIEQERRETMEGIRLRLLWIMGAGGDEGTVARTAISVIRFAEQSQRSWQDRYLRCLHRRLSLAEGLTDERFKAAVSSVAHDLFLPV